MGEKAHNGVYDCNGRWALGRCYVYVLMARDASGPMYVKIGVSDDPYPGLVLFKRGAQSHWSRRAWSSAGAAPRPG